MMKLPILEDDLNSQNKEGPLEEAPANIQEEMEETEESIEEKRSLSEFASEKDLNIKTLRKILYLLDEKGITLIKEDNQLKVTPFTEILLLETLEHFEEGGRKSYAKAVEVCLTHHGQGQEPGQA